MYKRHTFMISISEHPVQPSEGQAVMDMAIIRDNYPSHEKMIEIMEEYFGDWYLQIIPV